MAMDNPHANKLTINSLPIAAILQPDAVKIVQFAQIFARHDALFARRPYRGSTRAGQNLGGYAADTLSPSNMTSASQRTGKFIELATTQMLCAFSCSALAFSMSLPGSSTIFG